MLSRVFIGPVVGFVLTAGVAHGAISPVTAAFFGGDATIVTFSEVSLGTTIPFSVGSASFGGLGGLTAGDLGTSAPPAPSGDPFLYTGSVGNDDTVEVTFGSPQQAVGAYFNLASDLFSGGALTLEFYNGAALLGTVDAVTNASVFFGGFVGGSSDAQNITRVVFRETFFETPINFRLDDVTFVPSPCAAALLAGGLLTRRRR